MKKITTALLLVATLMGCTGKKKYNDHMGIPEEVEIKKEGNYIQFPGTRVFMAMPEDYELNGSEGRFCIKNDNQEIGFVKEHNEGIEEVKKLYESFLDSLSQEDPLQKILMQDFKLGNYDARCIQLEKYNNGKDIITLILGDDKHTITVDAAFTSHDRHNEVEVIDILLTTYIDPSAKPDPTPFAIYTIDLSGTEFKFNSFKNKDSHMYTHNGFDVKVNENITSFFITQVPDTVSAKITLEDKKVAAKIFIEGLTKDKSGVINNIKEQTIFFNNDSAYEVVVDRTLKKGNMKIKTYSLFTEIEGYAFVFLEVMTDDFDENIKTFKRLIQTVKLKR